MENKILYVEDNHADITLFKEFIPDNIDLTVISNGNEAKHSLSKLEKKSDLPDLIILDINLPDISGFELLKIVKSDDRLKFIPTVMFSSSDNTHDIKHAYSNAANGYVTKSMDLKQYREKLNSFVNFWMKTAELPGD